MSDIDVLWNQVDAAFKEHKVHPDDQTPKFNLNRIAAKCIVRQSFESSTCNIRKEVLSPDDLKRLILYSTDDDNPHWDVEPIVVLVYGGQWLVIDGRRRVTKWLKEEPIKPRSAIIITPRE